MADEVRTMASMNGEWDLAFDPKNVGKRKRWFARFPRSRKMQVPGVWEQIKPNYDGVGWYRKKLDVPEAWEGKTIRIRFMAASYYAECWVNGEYLGDHEGGYTPFEFDISGVLHAGDNELVVRIINPPINHELEGFRAGAPLNQGDLPIGKGAWYFNFGGLWQDVDLIVTDKVYVEDCFVKPRPDRKKAVMDVTIRNGRTARKCEVTCLIAPKGNSRPQITRTVNVKLKRGVNTISVPMVFKKVRTWSPDDPFLYSATVRIACDGAVCDEYTVRFGMREFTIKGGRYYLNGERIKLKGFLHQGMYPRTLSFPETRAFAVKELRLVKDNGFNFIRAHLKPAPWWYLDLTDEMGILIEGEPPAGWNSKSPHFERRMRSEVEGFMKRDRNHPSVVFWCLVNEANHYRGYTIDEIRRMTARLAAAGRKIDPTRLLMDLAGSPTGRPGEGGTRVMLPYTDRKAQMTDLHGYCGLPLHESSLERYRRMGTAGVALNISEYGAPLVSPDFQDVISRYTPRERRLGLEDYVLHRDFYRSLKEQFKKAGLARTFGTARKMLAETNRVRADEIRHITAAMRANPKLGGFALCQLSDASGELFGATDVWRKPKQTFHQMASVMTTPLLMPEIAPRVVMPGDSATVRAFLVNEDRLGATYSYRVEIGKPRGKVVETFTGKIKATREVQTPLKTRVKLDLRPGKYHVRATLLKGRKAVSTQSMEFTVIPRPKVDVAVVGAWDRGRTIRDFLRRFGVKTETYSNNYRNKNVPILLDMRGGGSRRGLRREMFGQLKKIVQLGGCAVLFGGDVMPLYEYLFPTLIRVQGVMRTIGYVKRHPMFTGLPSDCVAGYEYADVYVDEHDKGDDVVAAGGDVIVGGLAQHMWTRPAVYYWGTNLYTVPVGRGQVVVCNMKVLDRLADHRTAQLLMANIVNYAASVIKPGGEEKLLSRCIDPLSPEDYE